MPSKTPRAKPCPNCGRKIEGGRIEKKFCDDHCRMEYHRGGKLNKSKLRGIVARLAAEAIREQLPAAIEKHFRSEAR